MLVVEAGRVITAGNIADSADNNELRHSDAVMFPPAAFPRTTTPRCTTKIYTRNFFVSHWNLEYFVDVALGRTPARVPAPAVDLASPEPAASARRT